AWKALISKYITVIPLIGNEPCIAVQSMSGWPVKKPVHSAMSAKVGAAVRLSQPPAPRGGWPPPAQVSTSGRTTGDIDASVLAVLVVTTPPDTLLVAPFGGAIKPLIGPPEAVQPARIGRVGVINRITLAYEGAHARPVAPVGRSVGATGRRKLCDGRRNRRHVHRVGAARIIVFDGSFLLLRLGERDIEVEIEVAAMRRRPGKRPAHALLVGLELGQRRTRHRHQRDIVVSKVNGKAIKAVRDHRAGRAAGLVVGP